MLNGLNGHMNGKLKYLSDDECEKIHYSSLEVLEYTGVLIESKKALDMLDDFGCEVNRRNSVVKFPNYIVEECLKYTPHSVKLYGIDPKYNLRIEKRKTYIASSSGYAIIDRNTGEARDGTLQDVSEGAIVSENLDNIHSVVPFLAGVRDVPTDVMTPVLLAEVLKNTQKTIEFYLTGGGDASNDMDNILNLCKIISGSESQLKKKPFLMFLIDPFSPLYYPDSQITALLRSVEMGLPLVIMPSAIGGATAPITIAGMLVQSNAEFLAGLVLANLVKRGTPVMYGHYNTIMDMKTSIYSAGAVEMGILGACVAQMGNYYKIPTNGFYPMSDSHIPDQQVGYEKSIQWTISTFSGMNYLSGAGSIENGTIVSLEQLVLDNEIVGMVGRALEGVEIDEQRMAVDEIKDVGPKGTYLKRKHTREWMYKEYFMPKLSDKNSFRDWKLYKKGYDVISRSKNELDDILKNNESPVEKEVIEEINELQKNLIMRSVRGNSKYS